jgi:spermidine synthase
MTIALRIVAALAAGFGGLLFQVAILRRFALVLGSSAVATAIVLGVFLAGLGLGSFWAQITGRVRARTATGALGYAAVGASILLAEAASAAILGLPTLLGALWVLVLVGVPSAVMGFAFPHLFVALRSDRGSAFVLTANLLGAVVGAFLAGNLLVPEHGLAASLRLAAAAYFIAGGLLAGVRAGDRRLIEPDPLVPRDPVQTLRGDRLAFASGFLILAHEILLTRRLPFFLEGFQPTLSGVLVAVLLATGLGALVVALLPTRLRTMTAAAWVLVLAALSAVTGIHEHTALAIARWEVHDDFGYHLRILAAAGLAALPVGLLAGAVVPLLVASEIDPDADDGERTRRAARLYLAAGIGSLAAVALCWTAASWFSTAFFVVVPMLAALGTILLVPGVALARSAAAVLVLALTFGGAVGTGTPSDPLPPVVGSRYFHADRMRPLAHATDHVTTASVVYDRSQHAMVLFTDEFRAAWIGPGTSYMKVLGHLPFLLRDRFDHVAVIALGTGTTADAVCAWESPRVIDVVEISPAVLSLADRFAADGPIAGTTRATFREDPRVKVHVEDGRRYIATSGEESLDLVTMEPLLPYAPGTAALYSREFYAAVSRALRDEGLCVQWVPTHAMPEDIFRTLLLTFGDSFDFTSVWLFDQSTLLVGSKRPHLPGLDDLTARLANAGDRARTTLHEAGCATPVDLAAAFVGDLTASMIAAAPRLFDDRPFLERIGYWSGRERLGFFADNLRVLIALAEGAATAAPWPDGLEVEWTELRTARLASLIELDLARWSAETEASAKAAGLCAAVHARAPASVLLYQESQRARRQMQERAMGAVGLAAASANALRVVELDPGLAIAWAAASLRGEEVERRRRREIALAIDPMLGKSLRDPAVAGDSNWAPPAVTPLEDLGVLPGAAELATKATPPTPNGIALRAGWPVRVARGFAALAAQRDLRDDELLAARSVVDPASLELLCAAYGDRVDALGKVLSTCWRPDLPPPRALSEWVGDVPQRKVALAGLLGGRRSRECAELLAPLLVDGEIAVRRAAAGALVRSYGERIAYDPDGAEEERTRAAANLRALHNRRP